MIDTDKYEGHAEGPWKIESYNRGQAFTGINFNMTHTEKTHLAMKNGREKEREATANLIADAPLLLAELKRLREVMKKIGCSLCDECGLSIEEHIRYHTENDVIAGCPFGDD